MLSVIPPYSKSSHNGYLLQARETPLWTVTGKGNEPVNVEGDPAGEVSCQRTNSDKKEAQTTNCTNDEILCPT